MNFILPYNNIDKNNFSFIKPVKNRTIDNGLFYKLYYNNNLFIINTFMMNIDLEYMNDKLVKNTINLQILKTIKDIENYLFKKIINMNLKYKTNKKLKYITDNILDNKEKIKKRNNSNKKTYLSFDNNEYIKKKRLIIKINGIWEDNLSYGFSYNIMEI